METLQSGGEMNGNGILDIEGGIHPFLGSLKKQNKTEKIFKVIGNPLAVQRLGLHASPKGTIDSIPGGGSRTIHCHTGKSKNQSILKRQNMGLPWYSSG